MDLLTEFIHRDQCTLPYPFGTHLSLISGEVIAAHAAQTGGKLVVVTGRKIHILVFLTIFIDQIVGPIVDHHRLPSCIACGHAYRTIFAGAISGSSLYTIVAVRRYGSSFGHVFAIGVKTVRTVVIC